MKRLRVGELPQPPRKCGFLLRPRVIERMHEMAQEHRVLLLVSPPGYGKSVAVAQYVQAHALHAATFRAQAESGRFIGFVRGLAQALCDVAPHARDAFAGALSHAFRSSMPASYMASWLCEHLRGRALTIVLDDFHVASHDTNVCAFVANVIERSDRAVQWIIATRDLGQVPLASWLSLGSVAPPLEIEVLAFTPEEGRSLCARDGAPADAYDALTAPSARWPIALDFFLDCRAQLEVAMSGAPPDPGAFFAGLALRVLDSLAARERDLLFELAVYPAIYPDRMQRAEGADVRALMIRLEPYRSVLLSRGDGSYVLQNVFREFLLRHMGAARLLDAKLRRAAALEASGENGCALHEFASAESRAHVARILEAAGFDLIETGRCDVVEWALEKLDAGVLHARPGLLALHAAVLVHLGEFDEAGRAFSWAYDLAIDPLEQARIAYWFAAAFVEREPELVTGLLAAHVDNERLPQRLAAQLCALLAVAYARDARRAQRAQTLIGRALRLAESQSDDALLAQAHACASLVAQSAGDQARACASFRIALARAEKQARWGTILPLARVAEFVLGAGGEGDSARDDLEQLDACAARAGDLETRVICLSVLAHAEAERANLVRLAEIDDRLEELAFVPARGVVTALAASRALRAAWSAEFHLAWEELARVDAAPSNWGCVQASLAALYAAAAGERSAAQASIERCGLQEKTTQGAPAGAAQAEAAAFCALALLLLGKSAAAHHALERIHDHGGSSRLRALVSAIRAIYLQSQTGLAKSELAQALRELTASGLGGYTRMFVRLPLAGVKPATPLDVLTSAEMHVLRAIARGETSLEIAKRTGRQQSTVDGHVMSIRKKLACGNRRQAVALARDHGLIP